MVQQTYVFVNRSTVNLDELMKKGWHIASVTAQHVAVSTYAKASTTESACVEYGSLFIVLQREVIDGVDYDTPSQNQG